MLKALLGFHEPEYAENIYENQILKILQTFFWTTNKLGRKALKSFIMDSYLSQNVSISRIDEIFHLFYRGKLRVDSMFIIEGNISVEEKCNMMNNYLESVLLIKGENIAYDIQALNRIFVGVRGTYFGYNNDILLKYDKQIQDCYEGFLDSIEDNLNSFKKYGQ